jgi:hypothetical protein
MFAIAAVIAFAVAFILHVFGHGDGKIVTDAVILGLLFVAAHLVWGIYPWRRVQ